MSHIYGGYVRLKISLIHSFNQFYFITHSQSYSETQSIDQLRSTQHSTLPLSNPGNNSVYRQLRHSHSVTSFIFVLYTDTKLLHNQPLSRYTKPLSPQPLSTQPLTHSATHSHSHSLIHSLTQSLSHSLPHSVTHLGVERPQAHVLRIGDETRVRVLPRQGHGGGLVRVHQQVEVAGLAQQGEEGHAGGDLAHDGLDLLRDLLVGLVGPGQAGVCSLGEGGGGCVLATEHPALHGLMSVHRFNHQDKFSNLVIH